MAVDTSATTRFGALPNGAMLSDNAAQPNQSKYTGALAAMMALHFMIGFLTCLNDILVPHLKSVFDLNYTQAALIQFTFFTAYFAMSIPAGKVIAGLGYKRAIVVGLGTSAVGALLFYPASLILAYPVFLAALFTLASGFTVLQVAVNPYAAVLGKPETASSRLTLTQAFNSLGTFIAPRVGGLFILSATVLTASQLVSMTEAERLAHRLAEAASVQTPYIVFAGVLCVLAAVIALLRLPVIASVEEKGAGSLREAWSVRRVRLGALGIFAYVGAEVAIGSFLISFITQPSIAGISEQSAAVFVSYYWGGAMVGRFIGSVLLRRTPPGVLLAAYAALAAMLVATAILSSGSLAMWALIAVGFCNSIMFPNIFTLGIDGVGKLTGYASSIITMAIVGGAVVPLVQGALADAFGLQRAFVLPIFCYVYIVYFALKGWKHE